MSKAEKIRELTAEGMGAQEIAEQLDTSANYVYKVRSRDKKGSNDSEGAQAAQNQSDPSDGQQLNLELEDPEAQRDAPQNDALEQSDVQADEGDDLNLEDSPSEKSYECGECGADLEYLEKKCDNCGAEPMWSYIA